MEIIDFNPCAIRRRLSSQAEAAEDSGPGSALTPDSDEMVVTDQDDQDEQKPTGGLDEGKVNPRTKRGTTPYPYHDEYQNRSRIVIDPPFQLPGWIPLEAAVDCSLPYTSYEIPIPSDMNMDFCIDVMMGQDTIVFMFDNEAGDEYTWSILSF